MVQPRVELAGPVDDHDDRHHRGGTEHVRPRRPAPLGVGPSPPQDGQRQQAAGEHLGGAGEGGVVHEVGVGRADGHRRRRRTGEPGGEEHSQRRSRPPQPHQHQPEQQREHQVELLLDRQATRSAAPARGPRRGWRTTGPRSRSASSPRRRAAAEDVAANRRLGRRQHRGRQHQHEGEARQGGGHQPAQAADPEPAEVGPPGRGVLGQQQRGDQEAGQREEHRHAEEPAPRPRHVAVEQQHQADGEGSDAVERRVVARRPPPLTR